MCGEPVESQSRAAELLPKRGRDANLKAAEELLAGSLLALLMQALRLLVMRCLLVADLTPVTLNLRLHRLMATVRRDGPALTGAAGVEGAGALGAGAWPEGGGGAAGCWGAAAPVTSKDTAVAP